MSERKLEQVITARTLADAVLLPVVLGRFEWSGLPYGLTSEQVERFITCWSYSMDFQSGSYALIFEHSRAGLCILPAYPADNLSLYYMPTKHIVTGVDYQDLIDYDKSVPIYDNPSRQPLSSIINDTSKRLYQILEVSSANVDQQSNPFIFAGTSDEIKSLQVANQKRKQNPSGIIAMTQSAMTTAETAKRFFPIKPSFEADAYFDYYLQIYNRFLTVMGVDNISIQKRERLISSEAASNNQLIKYYRDRALDYRRRACEEANKMFGSTLSVEWKGGDLDAVLGTPQPGQPGV